MKQRVLLLGILFAVITTIFVIALVYKLDWVLSPELYLTTPSLLSFTLALSLLAADAFLPTPSSLVMLVSGVHFGPFGGSLLSITGLMLGNMIGFLVARSANEWLKKKFPEEARKNAKAYWKQWNGFALAFSRPIPVLAESILFLSATTKISFTAAMTYCLIGVVPMAIVFNLIGYFALQTSWLVPILSIIFFTVLIYWISQKTASKRLGNK